MYNIRHSQNFIKSDKLAAQLIDLARIQAGDYVVEIGPGEGKLTKPMIQAGAKILAVEMDEELAENLKNDFSGIEIRREDFLNFQLPNKPYKLVGNIPFALTTKIIRKVLDSKNPPAASFLIMQKEAAARLTSRELLSLKYRPWFRFDILKNFRPDDFYPAPSVDPVFFKIQRIENPLIKFEDRDEYVSFLTYCFLNSKNGLKTSLKKLFSFKQIGIISKKYNLNAKPSEISFEKWVQMFLDYSKYVPEEKKVIARRSSDSFSKKQSGNNKIYRSWKASSKVRD